MKYKLLRFSLLSMLVMLCGGNVFADQITMKYSGTTTTNMTGNNDAELLGLDVNAWSVVGAKGGNNNFPGLNKNGDFRLYYHKDGSNTITVSSLKGATINSISMTFNGNYNNVSVTVNGNAVEATDGSYTINNSSFVLGNANTTNTQVQIKEVVINYTAGETSGKTATTVTLSEGYATSGVVGGTIDLPTATVKAGDATLNTTVTWTSSNEDVAKIEGNTINLLAAGTAKITASFAGDDANEASSASFTVTVAGVYTSLKALQEAASATSTPAQITFTNVVVTAVKGDNAYLADADGYGVLLYTKNHGLEAGQVLNGTITANIILYRGQTEITDFSKEGLTITTTTLTPTEKTIDQITAANQSTLVTLKGVTFSEGKLTDGTNSITYYDTFSVGALEEGKKYDITGIVILYNTTIEISPRTADDIVAVASEEFKDFAVELNSLVESSEGTIAFGLAVAADGTVTRTADGAGNATIKGKTGNDHGLQNFSATVPVEGAVKITMGTCSWGGDVTVKNAAGETVATFTTKKGEGGSGCYKGNKFEDENIVSAKYVGEATTLTITGGAYVNFFAIEAISASSVTVAYSLGDVECQGTTVPTGGTYASGDEYTIPAGNYTLYKEGYTLTGWTDGTNTYATGATITLEGDLNLTPAFTANEVSLADRTEEVNFNFYLDGNNGHQRYSQNNGIIVTQATVNGKAIDVKADITGTIQTNNGGWHQVKNSFAITVPSCKGATVAINTYGDPTGKVTFSDGAPAETTGGSGNYTITATIADAAETVVIKQDGSDYWRNIAITLPVVQQSGGKTYTNEAAMVVWTMNNANDINDHSSTPDDVFATIAFSPAGTVTLGDAKGNQTLEITDGNGSGTGVKGLVFAPAAKTDLLTWNVKPAAGLTFTPTKLSGYVNRDGTDVENGLTVSAYTTGKEPTVLGTWTALRRTKTTGQKPYDANAIYKYEIELTTEQQAAFASGNGFFLTATVGVGSGKTAEFGEVTIEGLINGTVADVNKYTLAAAANPTEGGAVSKYPNSDEYEENTEVTLTATENFGYDFVNWTNAAGEEVSTEAKFKYTVTANETLTANFKAVETYELALTVDGTNDYMVTVSPAPTVVDGKNMYEAGTTVELNANQYEGLVTFTNWSDGETTSNKIVKMEDNVTLTASYAQADIIAGWDFYKAGNNGRKADFAATDNEADALSLVNTETGETSGWLDKSTVSLNGGTYEGFTGAATNWRTGTENGDVGHYHWQTKINAEAFTDINIQFQMVFNYNAYHVYDVEFSTDGENWTKAGSTPVMSRRSIVKFDGTLPDAANNQKDLYIRLIADKTSGVDTEVPSQNDGNTLAMFFITGTPKLVDDPVAPALVSSVPENGATGASASGKIVLNFDKKVQVVEGTKATLGNLELTPVVSGKVITFEYKGLDYATDYTFTLPANTVQNLTGATLADAITINFTTMARPTVEKGAYDAVVSNVDELVAAFAAAQNRADKNVRFRIFLKKGTYTLPRGANKHYKHTHPDTGATLYDGDQPDPITYFNAKNVSVIGEDRDATIITNTIPEGDTFEGKYGTASIYEGIGSSDVLQISGEGSYWQDVTISTGIGDALGRDIAIEDKGTKTIWKNTCLHGFQDTWVGQNDNGIYYFEGGVIRGRTDFICGKGDAYYNQVEFRQVAGGYTAVPSKPANIGWVMKDCIINGDDAVTKVEGGRATQTAKAEDADGNYTLGRPWGSGTPVALWIDTKMNVVPSAIGWNEMSNGWPKRFAEYNSTSKTGSVIDLSGRKKTFGDGHANNPELTAAEAAEFSDMSKMFGDWDPTLATEQAPVPANVKQSGNSLTWDDSNYALLWAVTKDGAVIGFTVEPSFELPEDGTYAVRAANEMGGLSEASASVVASGVTTGISTVETAEPTTTDDAIYTIQGVRVDKARKGLYIIGGRKVVIK